MVVLAGRVFVPGPGGLPVNHGQIPLGGVAVNLFLCEQRTPCFNQLANPIGMVTTNGDGTFRISVAKDHQ